MSEARKERRPLLYCMILHDVKANFGVQTARLDFRVGNQVGDESDTNQTTRASAAPQTHSSQYNSVLNADEKKISGVDL